MVSGQLNSSNPYCVDLDVALFIVLDLAVPTGSPISPAGPFQVPKNPGPWGQDRAKRWYNSQRLQPGRLGVLPIIQHAVTSQALHQIDKGPYSEQDP